jgi:hypothetical protein
LDVEICLGDEHAVAERRSRLGVTGERP